ncbi:putative DUF221 domain protein [Viridothelium virens]|uniref:Putative DUF221 domain protein n=1 Tax=Viridothelium virens TaxID=1048519 RepID=A0A6A6HBY2_VIRVR|nr:putative DUF221 domain protein [Viridothelium virens]
MEPSTTHGLLPRQSQQSSTDIFLSLIADPFSSQIQSSAFLSALGVSVGLTVLITLAFSLLRPYNAITYAPKLRHADQKHAPPPIGKGITDWVVPVTKTREQHLVDKIGLDAVVFLRFTHMCRNMFAVLSIVGCAIVIPVNIKGGFAGGHGQSFDDVSAFMKLTPQYVAGNYFWAFVVCAYLFDIIICYFLWSNYRAILRLRRNYFQSAEYQKGLHARSLMVTNIPREYRTDEGVVRLIDEVRNVNEIPRAAIARNVKDLPDLIEEHEDAVLELEGYLAKYLKNPDKLPAKRPMCKPSKKDKSRSHNQKVDAIDYLTSRVKELETEIKEVRQSVDKRDAMPYGFASFDSIELAHSVAYVGRGRYPQGSKIILSPKPHDLIWKNLAMEPKTRKTRNIFLNGWMVIFSLIFIVPNALTSVFLSNLSHLGMVWPGFNKTLKAEPQFWAVVQGIAAPLVSALFYLGLPAMIRRMATHAGDLSKTSRERHVLAKVYGFFVFNNLIVFSIFSAVWAFFAAVIAAKKNNQDGFEAVKNQHVIHNLVVTLCSTTTYWLTFLLQRSWSAALDLSQAWTLAWGYFRRRFTSPTPRQLIELTAPPPFEFVDYYNSFLFYATVAICFATLQPLCLPIAGLYFALDSYMKKYMLMYIFITKYESGGKYWRTVFNRFLFATFLGNLVIAVVVGPQDGNVRWAMLAALAPLPFLLGAFKWYCKRSFDDSIDFYTRGEAADRDPDLASSDKKTRRSDRVAVKFGHPALYKPLIVPMVAEKSQHLLKEVYRGRLSADLDMDGNGGYGDIYMNPMSQKHPGKRDDEPDGPFQFVAESEMDFANFKDREDFREDHGGEGGLYSRPDTPDSWTLGHSKPGSRNQSGSRSSSVASAGREFTGGAGTTYPAGYHQTPSALREASPAPSYESDSRSMSRGPTLDRVETNGSGRGTLLRNAAPMPSSLVPGGGTRALDDTSYDQFRRGRQR